MGLIELASATLRGGEQRVEIAAQNAVNADTPGYKTKVAYTDAVLRDQVANAPVFEPRVNLEELRQQGALFDTDGTLDLAVNGSAYLLVRRGEEFRLSRGGQFGIGSDGTIIDTHGQVLQLTSGGDAVTDNYSIEILPDGTMLDDGVPIGTIGMFESNGLGHDHYISAEQVAALDEAENSRLEQSMLERSNVTLSDEMVELMKAQRQIESGAQLVRAYDQLLDRAISTFGRSA